MPNYIYMIRKNDDSLQNSNKKVIHNMTSLNAKTKEEVN